GWGARADLDRLPGTASCRPRRVPRSRGSTRRRGRRQLRAVLVGPTRRELNPVGAIGRGTSHGHQARSRGTNRRAGWLSHPVIVNVLVRNRLAPVSTSSRPGYSASAASRKARTPATAQNSNSERFTTVTPSVTLARRT